MPVPAIKATFDPTELGAEHSVQDGGETDAEESDAQAELRSACSAGMLFQFQKCRAGRSPLRACRANA